MKRATTKSLGVLPQKWISIHALVKRATKYMERFFDGDKISIHALVKRATLYNKNVVKEFTDFNPRPREEGDLVVALYHHH